MNPSTDAPHAWWALLARTPRVLLAHKGTDPTDPMRSQLVDLVDVDAAVADLDGRHVWTTTNPLRVGATRRTADDVAAVAALFLDLDDVKASGGGMTAQAQHLLVDNVADLLGLPPSATWSTGGGTQVAWLLDDPVPHDERGEAVALLRRFRRLVEHEQQQLDVVADNVFDLPRLCRVPGSRNVKYDPARPVVVRSLGDLVPTVKITHALDDLVPVLDTDHAVPGQVVAPAARWSPGAATHPYVARMVDGWAHDRPTGSRHAWLLGQAVRLAAALRVGRITSSDHRAAVEQLAVAFSSLTAGDRDRPQQRGEFAAALRYGVERVERMTDDQALDEVGGQDRPRDPSPLAGAHGDGVDELLPPNPSGGSRRSSTTAPSDSTLSTLSTGVERQAALLANLRTGAWLDAQTFAELRYAVPGIIPEGLSLLVGPPKVGKSWITLGVCIAVASGGLALHAIPTGHARPVLLLALEDGDRRLQARARALLDDAPIPEQLTYLTRVPAGLLVETIDAWCEVYGDDALVVIDTLGRVMPPAAPGESAYARDYRIAAGIKRVADDRPGLSIVVVHHDRKAGSDDFVDSVSGTHGLAGAADTIIALGRPRTTGDGLLRVTGRDVVENDYAVRLVDGRRWELVGDDLLGSAAAAAALAAASGLGDLMARVVAAVNAAPEGSTAADVALVTGLDDKTTADYLARAARAARIDRIARGRYGPLPTPVESVESVESRWA